MLYKTGIYSKEIYIKLLFIVILSTYILWHVFIFLFGSKNQIKNDLNKRGLPILYNNTSLNPCWDEPAQMHKKIKCTPPKDSGQLYFHNMSLYNNKNI